MESLESKTALKVRDNKQVLVYKGKGEGETKWNGCAWNVLLVKLVINYFC